MKRFSGIMILLIAVSLVLGACSIRSNAEGKDELVVFTAASFAPVLQEINATFEQEHGVEVTMNKAGTQELKAQLEQGAKADLLISARKKDVEQLTELGLVENSVELASNQLVIIISKEGEEKIQSIQDLTAPGVRLVVAEENAPVGEFTRQLFANLDKSGEYGAGFSGAVLSNVVSNESNEQNVLSKVVLGEADAGVVYRSSLSGIKDEDKVTHLEVEQDLNVESSYYLVTLKDASAKSADYATSLLSDQSREKIEQFGFTIK